jgi:hypothetical protein
MRTSFFSLTKNIRTAAPFSVLFVMLLGCCSITAQNETSNWYFGNQAGLSFSTSPPSLLTGSMNVLQGCSSVSDNAGNLLFYTDGVTIWNKNHSVMANGQGLNGFNLPCQSSVIVRKPGAAALYFVFTLAGNGNATGLCYSIVDMSLAAGLGSVTALNSTLYPAPCDERISAAFHCNGVDSWVMVHQKDTNIFRAYLVNSGASTLPRWSQWQALW